MGPKGAMELSWTYSDIEAMRWNVNDSIVHHERRVYTEYLHLIKVDLGASRARTIPIITPTAALNVDCWVRKLCDAV